MVLLIVKNGNSTNSEKLNTNLLGKEFYIFSGEITEKRNNGAVKLKSNPAGEVNIAFDINGLNADIFPVLEYHLENPYYNFITYFVWKVKGIDTPAEMALQQSSKSIALLYRHPQWKGEIEQLGLSIRPQNHLGITKSLDSDILLETLNLRSLSFFSDYMLLKDYWSAYKPLDYTSINNITSNEYLPVYAKLSVFMAILIILNMLTWYFLKNNLLISIILFVTVWMITDGFYLLNMQKNTKWSLQTHMNENVLPDMNLLEIANEVRKQVNNKLNNPEELKSKKIHIVTSDKYIKYRLMYHLLPANGGNANLQFKPKKGDFYLIIKGSHEYLADDYFDKPVFKSVSQNENYELLEVIQ